MTDRAEHLGLRTFGTASLALVSDNGTEEILLDVSKLLALVTYLAAAPGRSATRDHLTDLLWDNLEPDNARHALRHSRWQIHQRTRGAIAIDGDDTLTLHTRLSWDRDDFLAAAEAGNVLAAVESYRGEFFPGFASPGSGEFERWIDLERARCRAVFVRCAESVVRQWLSHGRARDAASLARRVRDMDPLHPTGWRLLLESLVAARDTLSAVVEGDTLERVIAEQGIEPEPSLRTLLALVRRSHAASDNITRPTSPLARLEMIGREREFASLMRAWERAVQGTPTCVLVSAAAGFGKTRLLREFEARLQSLHARHVYVRGSRASRDIAFSLASDLVARVATLPGARAVSTETARILVTVAPSLASQFAGGTAQSGVSLESVAVRNALVELLEAVSYEKPVALLVDDLHWSDAPSRQIVASALEALERRAILLVGTDRQTRTGFVPSALPLPLDALGTEAIAMLIGNVATVPNEPWSAGLTRDLKRYTGGSPLFILEALQLALERGALDLADGAWRLNDPEGLAAILTGGSALRERVRKLSPSKQTVVRVLAIADLGLDGAALARAADHDATILDRALDELELEGFAEHDGARWMLAHQEFGEAALADLPNTTLEELEGRVGRALAQGAVDSSTLRRAATHLRSAADWSSLGGVLRRVLREDAYSGKHRPVREVAAALLGANAPVNDVDRVVRSLPWLMRVGIVTGRQRALAGAAAVLVISGVSVAGMLAWRASPNEPRVFATVGEVRSNGDLWIWEVPVDAVRREKDWSPGQLLERGIRRATLHGSISDVTPLHGREPRWVFERTSPDSGETDLYWRDASGAERRLTATRSDDIHPDPSPDGRYIVYATASTHPLQHTDIAVLDLADNRVRMLTAGNESDRWPRWSPSGMRIAFVRQHWDDRTRTLSVCLTALDASLPTCIPIEAESAEPRWVTNHLLEVTDAQRARVRRLDVRSKRWASDWLTDVAGERRFSSDAEWSLCLCRTAGTAASAAKLQLRRRGSDAAYTPVDHDSSSRVLRALGFRSEQAPLTYLDRLTSIGDTAFALLGVPFTVGIGGLDAAGRAIELPGLAFDSSDSTVALVDSTGVARPLRPGLAVIRVSAGGWRSTSVPLRVVPNDTTLLLQETWCQGIAPLWRAFGVPAPVSVQTSDGQCALANSGDGRFMSGAYAAAPFDASQGLALVARVSTPTTLTQWQQQTIELVPDYDLTALGSWDHATGYPWQAGRLRPTTTPACEMRFPGGPEGADYTRMISAAGSEVLLPPALARRMSSGAWFEVTLQAFPDGRCGVAVDGVPISLGEPARQSRRPFLLLLYGSSYDTRVLIGTLFVSRGVRPSIRWETLPP